MPALRLVTTSPAKNSYNVSTQPTVTLRFSAELDPTTVDHSLFYVTRTTDRTILSIVENSLEVSGDEVTFSIENETGQPGLLPETTYNLTISQGISDILGNALRLPIIIAFTTGTVSPAVPAIPVVVGPINGQYVKENELEITWTAVATATSYDVEVSKERSFFDIAISKTNLTGTTTELISEDLDDGQYFIRIRSRNASGISAWSEVSGFTYNIFADELGNQPTIINLWHTPIGFSVVSMNPPSGTVNKNITSVVFTFNNDLVGETNDVPDALTVYPEIDFEPLYGDGTLTVTNAEWAVSASNLKVLTYTPTAGFVKNATYTFRFPETFKDATGNMLIGETEFWLTTKFSVMYAAPKQIRLRLGSLADSFTTEQIAYHIFLASIDVNQSLNSGEALSIEDAITQATETTMEMTKAATVGAMVSLIDERLKEIASEGSVRKALGDLSISNTYDTIKVLQSIRDEAVLEYLTTIDGLNSVRSETLTQLSNVSGLQPIQRSNI